MSKESFVSNPKILFRPEDLDIRTFREGPPLNMKTVRVTHKPTGIFHESYGNGHDLEDYVRGEVQRKLEERYLQWFPRDRIEARIDHYDEDLKLKSSSSIPFGEKIVIDNVVIKVSLSHPHRRW